MNFRDKIRITGAGQSAKTLLVACAMAAMAVAGYQVSKKHAPLRAGIKKCSALMAPRTVYAQGVTTLWSADMEPIPVPPGSTSASTLGAWYLPSCCEGDDVNPADPNANNNGGGVFNSGTASASPSFDYNHTTGGKYSALLKIDTSVESGTRLFRWLEPGMNNSNSDLYYSVWYYFPTIETPTLFWNILQWKSASSSTHKNDAMFSLDVNNRGSEMYLYLCPPAFINGGSCFGQIGNTYYIPLATWTHVEAHYVCAGDSTGHVTIWEDGNQLFDVGNVQTRYADGGCSWSVNNYSNGLTPSPATIYVDDAKICQGGRCPL
jgi:hypothetical protein